jgi:hypothetical protein
MIEDQLILSNRGDATPDRKGAQSSRRPAVD